MHVVLAVLLVVLAGLPLGFGLTRNLLFAALLAPLVTALTCTTAVILMLIFGGTLLPWLVAVLVGEYVAVFLLLRRGGAWVLQMSWVDAAWLVLPLVGPLLLLVDQPTQWDAHSIWWLHAAYFTKDAGFAREIIANPVCANFMCDYPPLPSAPVAAVWGTLGGFEFRVAQMVSSLTTVSAIVMLGYAVRRVTHRAPVIVSRLSAVGVSLAVWATAPYVVTGGLSDALWSAAFVAAAVLVLYGNSLATGSLSSSLPPMVLPVLLLTVAALSKNEGFIAVVVLAAFVTLRYRRNLRRTLPIWIPVAAGLVWMVDVRYIGANTDLVKYGHFHGLLTGDPAVYERIPPTLSAMWSLVNVVVACSLLVAVLGALFHRRRRRELGIGPDLWMWLVGVTYAGTLVMTYATSPNGLQWHLMTSVDRVCTPLVVMACASAACWAAVASTSFVGQAVPAENPEAASAAPAENPEAAPLDETLPEPTRGWLGTMG